NQLEKVRQTLISSHSPIIRNQNDPVYNWGDLSKGLFCPHCYKAVYRTSRTLMTCTFCKKVFPVGKLLENSVKDFSALFPDNGITVPSIHEWIGGALSERYVYNFLKRKLQLIRNGK